VHKTGKQGFLYKTPKDNFLERKSLFWGIFTISAFFDFLAFKAMGASPPPPPTYSGCPKYSLFCYFCLYLALKIIIFSFKA
jgi:hypothetical protein